MENEDKLKVTTSDLAMASYIFSIPIYKLSALLCYLGIEIEGDNNAQD